MKTLHITYKAKDKLKTIKTLFYTLFFVAPLLLTAQTKTENYIKRTTYRAPSTQGITENDILISVTYFDGLGRPKQSVAVRAGGQGQDIVTPVVYDQFGRQTRDYLPYTAATQNSNIHPDPMTEVENFYNAKYGSVPNPYSEKLLEASPLNRVLKQGAPGVDWMADPASDNDHSIKFSYDANTAGEVRLYRVSLGPGYVPTLEAPGFYNPGTLYKTITKDENWQPGDGNLHTTEEFKDKRGRVVLKRTYNSPPLGEPEGDLAHDTYYVYDKFSNLTFVIPPKVTTDDGVSSEELDELCYQYRYDHRNRLVEKKLPGKGLEFIVYNKLDQPVFTQDQKLLTAGQWLFSKYDKFGRVIYTGLYDSTDSREALQTTMNGITGLYDTKTNSPTVIDGVDVYYDNSAFPNTNIELLTINYYDTYTFDLDGGTSEDSYGITPIIKPMMLATGNKTRILGTNQWITTVLYYDKKGSPVYTYSRNDFLGVTDKVKTKLSFTGEVLESTAEHIKDGEASITAIEKFTYDPAGRLLKHTHQLAGHAEETLVENVYDELGQLVQKKVGNTPAVPLQTVDYSYNIRGWLTGINDVDTMGNDLFGFNIRYNNPEIGSSPLYNGNISQILWRTANVDNSLKNYVYSYDALNRITGAIDNTGNYNLNSISYDKNGNILSLNRQGHVNEAATNFDVMDNLVYSYDSGNKLLRVEDTANDSYGFKDDAVATDDNTDDYSYDDNGNMLSDTNKGITAIAYNHLNLPTQVTINGENILYIYDAAGIKQQKTADGTTTQYAGAYIYENSSLKFASHAEGYIEPDGAGGYEYVYQYKDHLGNIRLSYTDSNNDGLVDASEIISEKNYYPFGLQHKGYNSQVTGTRHNWDYLNQERQEEFGLNWLTFRYRNYMPEIGRFFGVDPITEEYHYITPYQFASNNPVWKIELEGLEGKETSGLDLIRQGFANIWNAAFGGVRASENGISKRSTKERVTQFSQGGNMVAKGAATKEAAHAILDVAGTVDPTPITDTAHSIWYAVEGEYVNAGLTIAGVVPYAGDSFKALKYTKYSDEVADLVKTTGKLDGAPKEVVTVLKEGTLENGIKVANDVVGGLGDNAVDYVSTTGKGVNPYYDKVVGKQSADGKKGWRVDYDEKKGGHLNWWNGKEKGAIVLNAGREQIDQIIKNKTF